LKTISDERYTKPEKHQRGKLVWGRWKQTRCKGESTNKKKKTEKKRIRKSKDYSTKTNRGREGAPFIQAGVRTVLKKQHQKHH